MATAGHPAPAGRGAALPLALTMGDPGGIGPDITLGAWIMRAKAQMPAFCVLADPDVLAARARVLGCDVPVEPVGNIAGASEVFPHALPVWPMPLPRSCSGAPGRSEQAAAPAIIASIERAVEAVHAGEAAALVTNPIAKASLMAAGFAYPGHTEYLAQLAGERWGGTPPTPVMMLACDVLRVVPVTVHVPLCAVPGMLTRERLLKTARITIRALVQDFAIARPRLAMAGLNPHAGEDGRLGEEEERIIAPAVEELRAEGHAVSGPHPADTLFHEEARRRYDAALAMYHDQALIPIKTLAFERAANVTLGLPFVRTSPDHGTAFDIAGGGRASPESLVAALRMAAEMAARRTVGATP